MKKRSLVCLLLALCLLCGLCFGCKKDEPKEEKATKAPASNATSSVSNPTAAPEDPENTDAPADVTAEPTEEPVVEPYVKGSKEYAGTIISKEPFEWKIESHDFGDKVSSSWKFYDYKGFMEIPFDEGSVGVHFFATTSFSGVHFTMPTWGMVNGFSAKFEVYDWTNSYEETLETAPIATATIENWHEASYEPGIDFDTPMPDGEYLIQITTSKTTADKKVGIWHALVTEEDVMECYLNGDWWMDETVMMMVNYTETPTNYYGPLNEY